MVETVGGLNDAMCISVSLHRLQQILRVTLAARQNKSRAEI